MLKQNNKFEDEVINTCQQALNILQVDNKLKFRPMQRRKKVNSRAYVKGRINLKTGLITIDIFTPKKRDPKKISDILRTLCHEIAHFQKPPFRQLYRWRFIVRAHYPEFYQQVKDNIQILKDDLILKKYF